MKAKITVTVDEPYTEAFIADLRAFAQQDKAFKDEVIQTAADLIEVMRDEPGRKAKFTRKTLAVGAGILKHVNSLEVTPFSEE